MEKLIREIMQTKIIDNMLCLCSKYFILIDEFRATYLEKDYITLQKLYPVGKRHV